jgi:hypothetical protein
LSSALSSFIPSTSWLLKKRARTMSLPIYFILILLYWQAHSSSSFLEQSRSAWNETWKSRWQITWIKRKWNSWKAERHFTKNYNRQCEWSNCRWAW